MTEQVNASSRKELHARVVQVREIFLANDRVALIQADMDLLLERDNTGSEGGVLTLIGEPRSGKSKILIDYARRHPKIPFGMQGPNGHVADLMRVVRVKVPNNNVKTFTEETLAALSNLTREELDGAGTRRYNLQGSIFSVAKSIGLKLLLLEETHQGDGFKKGSSEDLAKTLKDFTNEMNASLVISGTLIARKLLECNSELEGRVLFEHELTPLSWSDLRERAMFAEMVHEIDRHLCEQVFGRLSGLADGQVLKSLMEAASGYIGHAATLIEVAGYAAVDELLAGKADCLRYDHLATAFLRSPRRRHAKDAFLAPATQQGYSTNLIGRTRKSNRDAQFRA